MEDYVKVSTIDIVKRSTFIKNMKFIGDKFTQDQLHVIFNHMMKMSEKYKIMGYEPKNIYKRWCVLSHDELYERTGIRTLKELLQNKYLEDRVIIDGVHILYHFDDTEL